MSYEYPDSFHKMISNLRKNYSNLSPKEVEVIEWLSNKPTFTDKVLIIGKKEKKNEHSR